MEVELQLPKKEIFIGSYTKVKVIIDPASGRPLEDLDFVLPDGPQAGFISLSRDADFNSDNPEVMLCAGYKPGNYILQAWSKQSSSVMAETEFIITEIWEDNVTGPSIWFTGISELISMGATWGGGSDGPQNMNAKPAKGIRRIAILLIDTLSQRYTNNAVTLQGFRNRWADETSNGVTTVGITRSAAHYYREVSYNSFDLSAQVFGPFSLTETWDKYFNADGSPKSGFYQACVSAGIGSINYNNFDTIICVSQSVNPTDPKTRKSAWPYGTIGPGKFKTGYDPVKKIYLERDLGAISMPNEWHEIDGREIHQTLSHEIGHNLGLADLYKPEVKMGATRLRNVGGWDIMGKSGPLPHFSIVNRMIFGWLDASSIRPFNFQRELRVDKRVSLHPIEQGTPPAGRYSGIEIRIADGKNYYFEYRNGQPAHIGDRNLPTNNRVVGTDAEDPGKAPTERPHVMLLRDDEDDDGSVLEKGKDYKETDGGVPFQVLVEDIDGSKADLLVRYNASSRPDPSIRPWPAAIPGREWQSPDIEVSNIRNRFTGAPKELFNVPWEGNLNWVHAKVKNSGDLNAPKVRVNFSVRDFSVNPGGPLTSLGSDVQDIPAGETVEFTAPDTWKPPRKAHYCIEVDIPFYRTPGSSPADETNIRNNFAQSNYDSLISRTDSPGSREAITIDVINPYDKPTRVFLRGGHTNPLYRTYLEHTSFALEPNEKKTVIAMFEYTGDEVAELVPEWQNYIMVPNNAAITAFIEDPRDRPPHTAELVGGVQIQVTHGRSTQFLKFNNDQMQIYGLVVTRNDNNPVPGDKVILIISLPNGKIDYMVLELSNGEFSAQISSVWQSAKGYYVPINGYADCYSNRIYNEDMFS